MDYNVFDLRNVMAFVDEQRNRNTRNKGGHRTDEGDGDLIGCRGKALVIELLGDLDSYLFAVCPEDGEHAHFGGDGDDVSRS